MERNRRQGRCDSPHASPCSVWKCEGIMNVQRRRISTSATATGELDDASQLGLVCITP